MNTETKNVDTMFSLIWNKMNAASQKCFCVTCTSNFYINCSTNAFISHVLKAFATVMIGLSMHRRRSGWNSVGDAWRAPKVDRCRMGRGVPSPADYAWGYSGGTWAAPVGSGAESRPKTDFGVFWRPQNAPFCTYMKKIWGGQFALASCIPNSWGLAPWSTPMYLWLSYASSCLTGIACV